MGSILKYFEGIFSHKSLQNFVAYVKDLLHLSKIFLKIKNPPYPQTHNPHIIFCLFPRHLILSEVIIKQIWWYSEDFDKELPELERQLNFRYSWKNYVQITILGQSYI